MRRNPPPPPPKKRIDEQSDASGTARRMHTGAPTRSHHVRRVTLNLLRHSTVCPAELKAVLNKLAVRCLWDLDGLTQPERELIYATVDGELADAAKAEFSADTETLVDHRHHMSTCHLCGHNPIRFEFTLRNTAGGLDVNTGSTCIERYGINVDGEAAAEFALRKLRAAIARAKKKAAREDWQEDHEDHVDDVVHLRRVLRFVEKYRKPGHLYRYLNSGWNPRARKAIREIRAAVRYYEREEFMTELQTSRVYGEDGYMASPLVVELNEAIRTHKRVRAAWDAYLRKHAAKMSAYELRQVERMRWRGLRRRDLTPAQERMLHKIKNRKN